VCVQRLVGTMMHMKISDAHHKDIVLAMNRTVTFSSVSKLLMILALFTVQAVVLHMWFRDNKKSRSD
jgi:hypothetical protein